MSLVGDGHSPRVGPKVFADIPSSQEVASARRTREDDRSDIRRPYKDDINRLDKSVLIASVSATLVSTYHITMDTIPVFNISLAQQQGVVPGVLFWVVVYLLTAKLVNYFEIAAINRVDVRRDELELAQQSAAATTDEMKAHVARVQAAYRFHVSVQLFRIVCSQVIVWLVAAIGILLSVRHGFVLINDVARHLLTLGSPAT